jgi:3-oxoacyl-[acyl-carrier protein] reductase
VIPEPEACRDEDPGRLPVAIISGGATGIGLAAAYRLAADGFHVVIFNRDAERGEAAGATIRSEGFVASHRTVDVTDSAAVRAAIAGLGKIDVLVHSAGEWRNTAFKDLTSDDFRQLASVNYMAYVILCRETLAAMPDGGRIVVISSRAFLGTPGLTAYGAAKAAAIGFSSSLARALAPRKIAVNSIAPGVVDTPYMRSVSDESTTRMIVQQQPMGRIGTTEELAELVAFLADENVPTTGDVYIIDGGRSLGARINISSQNFTDT